MKEDLEKYIGQKMVLDTRSSWIYIGALEAVTPHCAVLAEVDVHDGRDSSTSKELYVLESKNTGVKSNRERVHVNLAWVISFSTLDEIKYF